MRRASSSITVRCHRCHVPPLLSGAEFSDVQSRPPNTGFRVLGTLRPVDYAACGSTTIHPEERSHPRSVAATSATWLPGKEAGPRPRCMRARLPALRARGPVQVQRDATANAGPPPRPACRRHWAGGPGCVHVRPGCVPYVCQCVPYAYQCAPYVCQCAHTRPRYPFEPAPTQRATCKI